MNLRFNRFRTEGPAALALGKGRDMNTHNPHHFVDAHRRRDGQSAGRNNFVQAATRTVTSDSLFHGDHEIGIEHHGALYRLKITRQGKLILNK